MINVQVTGTDKLTARVERMRANIADLQPALMKAGIVIRDAAVMRIKRQGGDQAWAPTVRGGHIGIDTGRMWQSIAIYQRSANEIIVGDNVRTADGRYNYARIFQYGRGPIVPRAKKFLRFEVNGKVYYAKRVGPQPPRPFLLIGEAERKKIDRIFVHHVLALDGGSDAGS